MVRFRVIFASFALFALLLLPSAAALAAELPATRPCGGGSVCAKSTVSCENSNDCRGNVGAWDCFERVCYFDKARQAQEETTVNVFGVDVQTELADLAKPALEITIPGLNFSDTKQTLDKDGFIHIPYIGEFISVVYKYALLVGSILAVIMIIKNGVTIILSAGGEGKMESFHQIGQVIIGLIIMWGTFAILYTINPSLTQFKPLRIKYISGVALEIVDTKTFESITNQKLTKTTNDLVGLAIQAGVKVGFKDACFMTTILAQESGARTNVVGHDENYPGQAKSDNRKLFLVNGLKYTGEKFAAPAKAADYDAKSHNATDVKNDDTFQNLPPDYNLDWRFSHGFGLGQITLKPDYRCGGERGRDINGKCFTIPELLTPERNLEFTAELFKDAFECASKAGYGGRDQITAAFLAYNTGCTGMRNLSLGEIKEHAYAKEIMTKYDACVTNPPKISEPTDDFVVPSGDNIKTSIDDDGNPVVVSKALLPILQTIAAELKEKNIVLSITSGYRTLARQQALVEKNCENPNDDARCIPKSGRPVTCKVRNNDPSTCPHTRAEAVDAWGVQNDSQCITQGACRGSDLNDPCRANACQAAVIQAMRDHQFCNLNIEAWHFEQPKVSSNCN